MIVTYSTLILSSCKTLLKNEFECLSSLKLNVKNRKAMWLASWSNNDSMPLRNLYMRLCEYPRDLLLYDTRKNGKRYLVFYRIIKDYKMRGL